MQFVDGACHTGVVENVIGGNIYTIESNTHDDGSSREGYEVARRVRTIKVYTCFLRYYLFFISSSFDLA